MAEKELSYLFDGAGMAGGGWWAVPASPEAGLGAASTVTGAGTGHIPPQGPPQPPQQQPRALRSQPTKSISTEAHRVVWVGRDLKDT